MKLPTYIGVVVAILVLASSGSAFASDTKDTKKASSCCPAPKEAKASSEKADATTAIVKGSTSAEDHCAGKKAEECTPEMKAKKAKSGSSECSKDGAHAHKSKDECKDKGSKDCCAEHGKSSETKSSEVKTETIKNVKMEEAK